MSILSEILNTGHVDQDLLDALDDEQKQLLFCQMRAEQVRKWELGEAEFERNGIQRIPKRKSLRWLTGDDGEVWVWVMGDHEQDRTIDEILEEENRERAHNLAMRELRIVGSDSDEDVLIAQLGRLQVGLNNELESIYGEADSAGPTPLLLFQPNKSSGFNTPPSSSKDSTPPSSLITTTTISSYSTPQPQKAQLIRGERPPLMPKPAGYFAQFTSQPQPPPSYEPIEVRNMVMSNGIDNNVVNMESYMLNGVKMRAPRNDDGNKEEEVQKRESEIFQSLVENRERLQKEAEAEEERRNAEWEEQQRKSREAESAHRELALKAREKHKQLIRTSTSILPALKDRNASSLREAIKNLPRPPKPKSRSAIVEWFQQTELPRGTGLDPKTYAPAPWFHGIISREQAEVLLTNKPSGSFLVRVSERIWGYTVSYASKDGSFKHFLVERIPEGYQFLGTNQVVHDQLFDLVAYHESAPITAKGLEILKWAVGQNCRPTDYSDLILDNNSVFTTYSKEKVRTIPTRVINGALGRF